MIRGRGYVYSAVVLLLDILIGGWFGCIIAVVTVIYAFFIGEWYAKKKYGAILCDAGSSIYKEKLRRCFLNVDSKVNQKYTYIPKKTMIYIIPDQKIQAYAFGRRSIGVTEGALNLDAKTLEALIAHEYGHIVNGDSVLNMVLSAAAVGMTAILAFYQFTLLTVIYLIVIFACMFGFIKFSFLSYMITDKLVSLFKKTGEIIQHITLIVFRIIIRAFARKGELMADSFACSLGYAFYLRRFLERFDDAAPCREKILDVLYETHPPRDVRLRNLDKLQIDRRV